VASPEPPTFPREVFTSAPANVAVAARSAPSADPEAALQTHIVSGDRQEQLETRIVEPPPKVVEAPPPAPSGLPDSRVARGVEDAFIEIKRLVLRLGRVGRLSFLSHGLVVVGAVCPWFYVPHQGLTPGVERWGWLPLLLSVAAIATLLWRFRQEPRARVLPVLAHLALSAGLVLSVLWIYRLTLDMPDHLQPAFAFGFFLTAAGAAGAAVGALIGVKDVR
jgi:hypothetical protein